MKIKQKIISAIFLLVILFIILIMDLGRVWDDDKLKLYFLDVGQGDSIFIEAPNKVQVLIDAGRNEKVLKELDKILPIWDRHINLLVISHGDLDHIGGFFDVIESYEVEKVLRADTEIDSKYAIELLEQIKNLEIEIQKIKMGDKIVLDQTNEIYFETYWPPLRQGFAGQAPRDPLLEDSNENSLVLELIHRNNEFLFAGDATIGTELEILKLFPEKIDSDVLKVGHHGSKTSTSKLFLEKVTPEFSILSYGENSYGHPHSEVLETLRELGGIVLHTKKQGTIGLVSDGEKIELFDKPSFFQSFISSVFIDSFDTSG